MHFRDLVTKCRSYRRYDSGVPVTEDALRELVELACYVPSAKNLQPLKFITVCNPASVDLSSLENLCKTLSTKAIKVNKKEEVKFDYKIKGKKPVVTNGIC